MAFMEPNNLLYGISELPARLYGGIVYSYERINNQATKNKFIPQQNTSAFLKRDLLFPRPSVLPVPICQIQAYDYTTEINRVSRVSSDVYTDPAYHATEQNRNLLSGEMISEDTVTLWCVDDNSDRKTMHELVFKFDVPPDPHLPIRVNREFDSWRSATKVEFPSSALELRAYDREQRSGKVFVRHDETETGGLSIYDSSAKEISTAYKWPIRYFERIAHMDEVAVVNADGMVFYGQIGSEEFSRIKSDDRMISVATTDSPSELLMISKEKVFRSDIRTYDKSLDVVFSLKKDEWKIVDPVTTFGTNFLKDRERIWHVKCAQPRTETYFVNTSQRIYVFDRRVPNLPLFYTNHFNFNGGEFCMTAPPFSHQELEIDVYQYFSVSRILKPCVCTWSIGWNKREAVWTSMGPPFTLDSAEDVINLCQSQPHLPNIPDKIRDRFPDVARAIHYQSFTESLRSNENRGMFFRQMDNGQIWFDSINFAKPVAYRENEEGTEKDQVPTKESANEIIDFLGNSIPLTPFWEFQDDDQADSFRKCLEPYDYPKLMRKFADEVDRWRPVMRQNYSQIELEDVAALIGTLENPGYEQLKPPAQAPPNSKHTFSMIVCDMAEKTKKLMEKELDVDLPKVEFEEKDSYGGQGSKDDVVMEPGPSISFGSGLFDKFEDDERMLEEDIY